MFGERPSELSATETVDQKVWKKHQAHLKRLENHPLKKAEYYLQLKESTGIRSVRGLAEITREDWSYIARVLKIVELPAPIKNFLITSRNPTIIKTFHLRCLLEIVRLKDKERQLARFRELVEDSQPLEPL